MFAEFFLLGLGATAGNRTDPASALAELTACGGNNVNPTLDTEAWLRCPELQTSGGLVLTAEHPHSLPRLFRPPAIVSEGGPGGAHPVPALPARGWHVPGAPEIWAYPGLNPAPSTVVPSVLRAEGTLYLAALFGEAASPPQRDLFWVLMACSPLASLAAISPGFPGTAHFVRLLTSHLLLHWSVLTTV